MTQNFQSYIDAINDEIDSLQLLADSSNANNIERIVSELISIKGKIVFTGIGKSGIIAKKIAATFASTGTESIFLHSTEAFHGDLGMINENDFLVLISYSGKTDEVLKILAYCKRNNIPSLSLTGNPNSILALQSDFHIEVKITKEACPLSLAPTSSTTVTLAIGDALAIALMTSKKINSDDFAKFHPGGSLGSKLLSRAKDIMHHNIPKVGFEESLIEAITIMSTYKYGFCCVYNENTLVGIITDGDLRRYLETKGTINLNDDIKKIINKNPIIISEVESIDSCESIMYNKKVSALLVKDKEENVTGVITKFDIT
jgi:arabinose-5-phosphate isomerase